MWGRGLKYDPFKGDEIFHQCCGLSMGEVLVSILLLLRNCGEPSLYHTAWKTRTQTDPCIRPGGEDAMLSQLDALVISVLHRLPNLWVVQNSPGQCARACQQQRDVPVSWGISVSEQSIPAAMMKIPSPKPVLCKEVHCAWKSWPCLGRRGLLLCLELFSEIPALCDQCVWLLAQPRIAVSMQHRGWGVNSLLLVAETGAFV